MTEGGNYDALGLENMQDDPISAEFDELAAEVSSEVMQNDPTLPQKLQKTLQSIATQLQNKINKTWSVNEHNNDARGELKISIDATSGRYCFKMESFGITTKLKFVPEAGPAGRGRLVLYAGEDQTEYMSVSLSSLSDTGDIEEFLGWVNSANKEIYACEDYAFLEDLPRLLSRLENKQYFAGYYERYVKIMQEKNFYALQKTAGYSGTSRPLIDWKGNRTAYMDARWEGIKAKKKPQLDNLFRERGITLTQ